MSVNAGPWFKVALVLQAIFTTYLLMSIVLFLSAPNTRSECDTTGRSNDRETWFDWEPVVAFSTLTFVFSCTTLILGAIGYYEESPSTLRHVKLAALCEGIWNFSAIIELTRSIAHFEGRIYGTGWKKLGCPRLTEEVYLVHSALFFILFLKVPFLIILESHLKSLGDDFVFFDYFIAIFHWIRNCWKYGRQSLSLTSSFIRSNMSMRLAVSVRVSQKNDTLFREVEIRRRLGAISLELLKENIAHKYDRQPNDIIRLIKNGNVLIVDDADVLRLSSDDVLEVEFEDQGQTNTSTLEHSESGVREVADL